MVSAAVTQATQDPGRRLEALVEISRLVTLGLDEQAILRHVTEAVARLLGSPYARLWLLEEPSAALVLVAAAGALAPAGEIGLRRPASLRNLNRDVLDSGQIYQTVDVEADPRWSNHAITRAHGLHTYLGVPLLVGDRRFGILTLLFPERRVFGPEDLELVETVAAHAAAVLANARAYAESRRRGERLATLAEISRLVTDSLNPQAVLQATTQAATRLLEVEDVRLWLYDAAADTLRLSAWMLAGDRIADATVPVEGSLLGRVLRSGQPFVMDRATARGLCEDLAPPADGPESGLIVPFFDRQRPLGVLVVLSTQERIFDQSDIGLVQVLAAQVSVAIRNAQWHEEVESQSRRLATILDVNKRLALGPDLPAFLSRITEEAARLLGVEAAGLRLLEGNELVRAATFGSAGAIMVQERLPLGESLSGRVAAEGRPIISAELTTDPRHHPVHRAEARLQGFHSWLGVPLRGRDHVVGVLFVVSSEARQFGRAETALLEAFADQAAIAVENARLFQREQERRRQLEAVREVAGEIAREFDLTTLLELIIRRAAGLVEAPSGLVHLWDEADQVLIPRARHGLGTWIEAVRFRLGEGVAGTAAGRRKAVIVNNYSSSPYAHPLVVAHTRITAVLSQPILYQDRLIGAITVHRHEGGYRFSEQDRELLHLFARQAAIAIENARLFEQSAAVEALRELDRLKTEFLNTISHELRTPVSLIHGFAELLMHRASRLSPEQVAEMAAEIHAGTRTLTRLAEDLSSFSEIDRGTFRLQPRRVDLTDVLRSLVETFRQQPGGDRITAEVGPKLEATIDPERVSQVVSNLLSNALRYAPEGPIVVRAGRRDGSLRVEVTDRGPGIPADEQPRVWEKFFRGAREMNSPNRGSGLGLAVVKQIVELHGGEVGLRSLPGRGTTFWFTLPADQAEPKS